ncbi:DNAse I-like superfamily protein isoform X2 [Wolffia australiana]
MKSGKKKTNGAQVLNGKLASFLKFCWPPPTAARRQTTDARAGDPATAARIATFNAAMFSAAPAVPRDWKSTPPDAKERRPKSILKHQQSCAKSEQRVSINLPLNEISLLRERKNALVALGGPQRSVVEVLSEVCGDIIAVQNVKAEEEKGMSPLADLAAALGMGFVFAESWAPQFGNAILSRWPITRWTVQNISDDADFRNVLKAVVEVPELGEITVFCIHLDHLSEECRMTEINALLQGSDGPHLLAGGLNALDETDYSSERWNDIIKFHEEIGKPRSKSDVTKFLKDRGYVDAKGFAGECEAVVVLAKGQGYMQLRHTSGLHTKLSRFAVRVRPGFLLCPLLQGNVGPPHRQGRRKEKDEQNGWPGSKAVVLLSYV